MASVKELKSIDLSSYTIIATGISVLFSIIAAIFTTIAIGISSPGAIGVSIYIIPTIIIGTFMFTIYYSFSEGLFYNILSKKFKNIKLTFNDKNEIIKISNSETAFIIAIIITIQAVLLYLVSSFVLPLVLNATVQTLMMAGQQVAAYSIYQILVLLNQPITIAVFVFGSLILTFIFVLLGTYIYNIIASKDRGIIVKLSQENNLTAIDSIDMMRFAIAFAIISGILSIVVSIIMIITGMNIPSAIGNIVSGFIGGFVEAALIAIFYNYLAPKLGKLKLELIDQ